MDALVLPAAIIALMAIIAMVVAHMPGDTGTYLFPPTPEERAADAEDEAREQARRAKAKQMASPAMQREPAPWFQ